MKPVPGKPIRLSGRQSIEEQIAGLPQGMYQAIRYDTDNESKLHLWNMQSQSFDLVVPKLPPESPRFV